MNIICNDARKLLLVSTDSAKQELSKTDGLGPRYKQHCGVGVHVDISIHRQEGVNVDFHKMPSGQRLVGACLKYIYKKVETRDPSDYKITLPPPQTSSPDAQP